MIVCPDCRNPLPCSCGWEPINTNYLGKKDRTQADSTEYIETYNILAQRNMVVPVTSNSYVETLAINFLDQLDITGKDYCDVGSGRGFAVKHALELGAKSVTAVDIAEVSLSRVAEEYKVRSFIANAERLPFEFEFDVISATDILEHVLNMGNFLCCANWALRDNGLFGVRVPFMENLILYSNYHGLPMHYTHLRTFDKKTLVDLIEQAGFKVEKVIYDGWNSEYPNAIGRILPSLRRYKFAQKPIEIGVIARKVEHIQVVDAHSSLAEFAASVKAQK